MTSTETTRGGIRTVDEANFPGAAFELWRRSGWTIERALSEDTVVISRDTDIGSERRVLRALPAEADADDLREALRDAETVGADGVVAVTQGEFTEEAVDVADAHGVDIVGPESIDRVVSALSVESLIYR